MLDFVRSRACRYRGCRKSLSPSVRSHGPFHEEEETEEEYEEQKRKEEAEEADERLYESYRAVNIG